MQSDIFWQWMEQSRQQAEQQQQSHPHSLTVLLQNRSPEEIAEFDGWFQHYFQQAYDWTLWAAAYLILGGCSDDGFMDFRTWLIAQGKERFEATLHAPDSLADWLEEEDDVYELDSMDIWSVAAQVYRIQTGSDLPQTSASISQPHGKAWQEEELEDLLPHLYSKFA